MPKVEKEVLFYETSTGKIPFEAWLEHLKDRKARAIIQARLDRLGYGDTGRFRALGLGLFELKIFFKPGYRVYYGEKGGRFVILLCGGDKSTQKKDIQKAREYWEDYKERT